MEKGWSSTKAYSSDEGSDLKAGSSNGRSGLHSALRPHQPSKRHGKTATKNVDYSETLTHVKRYHGNSNKFKVASKTRKSQKTRQKPYNSQAKA